jgi:hypothetical protein
MSSAGVVAFARHGGFSGNSVRNGLSDTAPEDAE